MHSLTLHPSITETQATEAIMNACRANPARETRGNVSFLPTPVIGGHEAIVRNAYGIVVALANVDEFDC